VLSVEDWAEIRRLHGAEGMPIKAIVRATGVSRNAVRRALAADRPPKYERPARGSLVDAVEPQVRGLLMAWPTMPATVIAERIGWTHSSTILKDRVRELRPLFLPADPASRTTYSPGELAQCDLWFPPVDVPLGAGQAGRPPVLVMVVGYSRWVDAVMICSRQAPDLIAGHWLLLQRLGAVPKALVWDNESAVGSWRAGRPKLTDEFEAFRGMLGIKVIQCRPRDPEAKGLVERANGYLETSFLPGRTFASPVDFNTQLASWLVRANDRQHRSIGCRPSERVHADQQAMLALPPVEPTTGWRMSVRLPRDHYVRLDSNDYSVHPSAVGRRVEVIADLERVSVLCAGRLVAEHDRCWARHQTITDPDHHAAAELLRAAHRAGHRPDSSEPVEQRCLIDYDTVFGLTEPDRVDGAVA
jgi:transposase